MKVYFLLLALFINLSIEAQTVDNSSYFRNIPSFQYIRLHYENDVFSNSDKYYTQGINLEFVHPSVKKFFVSKILIKPANNEIKYGVSVELNGYTPISIEYEEILKGDRPFAAVLILKTFSIATNSASKEKISSSISAGVMGPAALGKEIQTGIHKAIGGKKPLGWSNQIQNDIILNYQVDYERMLFSYNPYFFLSGTMGAKAGTLSDKIYSSFTIMIGLFENPATPGLQKRKIQFYFFEQPLINLLAYDATLQGGVFNKSSRHVISSSDINRITFQNNIGVVLKTKKFYLEYVKSFLTKEFKTGGRHSWGGVRFGFIF